jgi:hypothetical protein
MFPSPSPSPSPSPAPSLVLPDTTSSVDMAPDSEMTTVAPLIHAVAEAPDFEMVTVAPTPVNDFSATTATAAATASVTVTPLIHAVAASPDFEMVTVAPTPVNDSSATTASAATAATTASSVDYLAVAITFVKGFGKITESHHWDIPAEKAEALRQTYLNPDSLRKVAVIIQQMDEGKCFPHGEGDYGSMETLVTAKFGLRYSVRSVITAAKARNANSTTANLTPAATAATDSTAAATTTSATTSVNYLDIAAWSLKIIGRITTSATPSVSAEEAESIRQAFKNTDGLGRLALLLQKFEKGTDLIEAQADYISLRKLLEAKYAQKVNVRRLVLNAKVRAAIQPNPYTTNTATAPPSTNSADDNPTPATVTAAATDPTPSAVTAAATDLTPSTITSDDAAAKIKTKPAPADRVAAATTNTDAATATTTVEKKKPGRKPKAATVIPTSTTDTNPAPQRVTRSKRSAESAGIDDPVASVSSGSRKNQRRA